MSANPITADSPLQERLELKFDCFSFFFFFSREWGGWGVVSTPTDDISSQTEVCVKTVAVQQFFNSLCGLCCEGLSVFSVRSELSLGPR